MAKEKVKEFIADVSPDKRFITKSGIEIKNIYELYDTIYQMDDSEFEHHVDYSKNDFKNWIFHVVKDEHLANELSRLKIKDDILKAIENRLKYYKSKLEKKEYTEVVKEKVTIFKDGFPEKIQNIKKGFQERREKAKKEAKRESPKEENTIIHEMSSDKIQKALKKEFLYGLILGIILGLLTYTILLY